MARALTWLAIAYVGLKFAQIMLSGKRGYRRAPISLAQRLRAGEPWLFALAFVLAVPLSVGAAHYHRQKFTDALAMSADCYGRLKAFSRRLGVDQPATAHAVYAQTRSYKEMALDAAAQLAHPRDDAMRLIEQRADAFGRPGAVPSMAALQRCLASPRDVPNA